MRATRRAIRWWRLTAALGIGVSATLVALVRFAPPPVGQRTADENWESRDPDPDLKRRLEMRLPEVNFNNVGLAEAIDFVRDTSGLKVVVNWETMRAAGVGRETPVTARLTNVRTSKALDIILRGAGGNPVRLDYWLSQDRVIVSTRADYVARDTILRVYDVRDLVGDAPPSSTYPAIATRRQRFKNLPRLIEDIIASDTWADAGGTSGQMRAVAGRLIVSQTKENHRQIETLLAQVRETLQRRTQTTAPSRETSP